AEREADHTYRVLERQLAGALKGLPASGTAQPILAYEPVWAIGTGRNAAPEQAQQAHAFIRKWLREQISVEASEAIRIQYGGSVTAANAASVLRQPDVDGALVGGASLSAEAFGAIVNAAREAKATARASATKAG
ncbi:MAG: triose-phosphate isomerase, partial [Candidatus Omnitrophica bacterium]|nr:triose-phosphate isomerase [Candidatus Omnitrophota bacterium]